MALQVVYVLTNPAMPGFVKIGMTAGDDVNIRLAQLYSTGVPFPFDLVFACRVQNAEEVEKALHRAFAPNRVNQKREFFKIDPDQAIAILRLLHVEDATAQIEAMPSTISEEEREASQQFKARRPNLNFKEMNIPIGSQLYFNDGHTVVQVTSEKKVSLNGEEMSLTAATRQILKLGYSIQPSPKWTYNGRLLTDIYNETYLE